MSTARSRIQTHKAMLAELMGSPKLGRPIELLPADFADEVIEWISAGKTLASYSRQEGRPKRRTVSDWTQKDSAFAARFARAREEGFDVLAERVYELANEEPSRDNHGRVDSGWVQWRRNQMEYLLKLLAKWDPKRYGDMQRIAHGGDPDAPPVRFSEVERATKIQALLAAARKRKDSEEPQ